MEVIDWETWSFSIRQLLFRSSQISTYTLTVRDVLIDSHVAALCPKDHLFLALGQASLGVCHKAELSLETGQVRLEMLHTKLSMQSQAAVVVHQPRLRNMSKER